MTNTPRQQNTWKRKLLALLSVPALAVPSAVGVYRYLAPETGVVAAASAAIGFEVLYLGVNLLVIRSAKLQRYARNVSLAAVATAITFNTLAHYAAKVPAGLSDAPFNLLAALLALLASVPLAGLAYAVSLLLHQLSADEAQVDHEPSCALPGSSESLPPPALMQCAALPQLTDPTPRLPQAVTTLQPTTEGWNAGAGYRCPRCGAAISQAVYAASQRWGDKWRGCKHCRATA